MTKVTTLIHALEGMPEDLDNFQGKTERDIRVRWLVRNKTNSGPGPWKKCKNDSKDMIVLKPSDMGKKPQLDEVHLPIISDGKALARRLGLKANDPQCVHFAPIMTDPKTISTLDPKKVEVISNPGLSLFYLGFCRDQAPFDNSDLRKAVVSSLNVRELPWAASSYADPAVGPVPPNMKDYDPNIKQLPYEQSAAIRFLEQSHYHIENPLTFVYVNPPSYANDLAVKVTEQINNCFSSKLKVRPIAVGNWEGLVAAVKAKQGDMFLYSWHQREGRANDPQGFLSALFHSRNIDPKDPIGKTNLTRYRNAEVDRLLDSGTPGNLLEAQKKIVGDAPMVFLSHPRRVSAYNKAVKKLSVIHDGLPEDQLVEVIIKEEDEALSGLKAP